MLKAILALCLCGFVCCAEAAEQKPLIVLQQTGRVDHGLPVVTVHPDAKAVEAVLNRGFAARLMRLDHMVQQRLYSEGKGPVPEPDYLVLTNRTGGFPVKGFVLNGKRQPSSRWVDLPQSQTREGMWGAIDQIFPHELAHIVMARLVRSDAPDVPVQVHAVGVRTSPSIAFQEGFGEHVQIMALDDPCALPSTAALAKSDDWNRRVATHLSAYRRELEATVSFGGPMRMVFPLWYGGDEQMLRYHAVKTNAFAWKPVSDATRLAISDPYRAYLLDRALPGTPGGAPRTPQQMMQTEGVVSHIFWRWVTSPEMGRILAPPEFYASFGTEARALGPIENMYLKIFAAAEASQAQDLPALLRGYEKEFPAERALLEALIGKALLGQSLPDAPNLWIANPESQVGTSLFDQWRGLPQPNTFDLNAADAADLAAIPGVSAQLAQAIQKHAPYRSLKDVGRVPGMNAAAEAALRSHAITPKREQGDDTGVFDNMRPVVFAYLWRMLAVWAAALALGGLMLWIVEPWSLWRMVWRTLLGVTLALPLAWVGPIGIPGGMGAVLILMALPTALWRLRRKVAVHIPVRGRLALIHPSLRGVLAWTALLLPAFVLVHPW